MPSNINSRNKNSSRAFSLIEISMVILIIGILIAGIAKGVDLYQETKLITARTLTQNSRVARIADLVAWFEPTAENVFSIGTTAFTDIRNINNNQQINRWKDSNALSLNRLDATQTNASNQPRVVIDNSVMLPVINFRNSQAQFLNLPDGTVPFGNSPYSVIIVSKIAGFGTFGILGSGTYGTNNSTNAFRHSGDGTFVNYWWSLDIYSSAGSMRINRFQIVTTTYDLSNRRIYVDGALSRTLASSNRASTRFSNTIGTTNGNEYMNGDIAEIIIYQRAISDNERRDIENYLAKKWSIRIS